MLPGTDQMVASAYERYLDLSPSGDQLASNFKDAFSIDCPIEFLGLWYQALLFAPPELFELIIHFLWVL